MRRAAYQKRAPPFPVFTRRRLRGLRVGTRVGLGNSREDRASSARIAAPSCSIAPLPPSWRTQRPFAGSSTPNIRMTIWVGFWSQTPPVLASLCTLTPFFWCEMPCVTPAATKPCGRMSLCLIDVVVAPFGVGDVHTSRAEWCMRSLKGGLQVDVLECTLRHASFA